MRHQRGFTLYELVYSLGFVAFWVLVIGVVIHFVLKFW